MSFKEDMRNIRKMKLDRRAKHALLLGIILSMVASAAMRADGKVVPSDSMPGYGRFLYVLEYDRRGLPWAGTPEQQNAIRSDIQFRAQWGTPLDLTMQRLARMVKQNVKYLNISFESNIGFGRANWTNIYLNKDLSGEVLLVAFYHELGHVVGLNFYGDGSEGWAEAFKGWVMNGCPVDHPVWQALEPVINV